MSQADRRVDSAICLPPSGLGAVLKCFVASAAADKPRHVFKLCRREANVTNRKRSPFRHFDTAYFGRAHSSAGQSYRLITGWSLVRIQVGPPHPHQLRLNTQIRIVSGNN